jgi:hypothetical protein
MNLAIFFTPYPKVVTVCMNLFLHPLWEEKSGEGEVLE